MMDSKASTSVRFFLSHVPNGRRICVAILAGMPAVMAGCGNATVNAPPANTVAISTVTETLAARPDAPLTNPDAPTARPDARLAKTDAPAARSDAPLANTDAPTAQPAEPVAKSDAAATQAAEPAWAQIAKVLEHPGEVKDGIDTITIPRDDLDVSIDGMAIPTGAGIASVFHFYRCPCGKMNVAGEFVLADYEANDVVDALRKNAAMNVASVAPFLLYERPRLLLVRFQGEGDPVVMAGILREALRWTGKERMAPDPPAKKD